jgi:LysM repeat protein
MNNPNPFVPKGSLLEQQNVRRSRLKIFVSCVLATSVCALVIMLIQGCKREAPTDQGNAPLDMSAPSNSMTTDTSALPPPDMSASSNSAPMTAAATSNTIPTPPAPMQMPPPPQQPIVPEAGAGTDYVVVQGDTLGKIAKAHGVTLKALEAANPGLDPKKLKIKQKLTIPAPTQSASTDATSAAAGAMGGSSGETYVVKSGDTLSKIAKKHGVTLKALRAANPTVSSTDHIKVGDKLTIPAKTETAAPAPAATDTSAVPAQATPYPGPSSSPVPPPAPGH